MPHVKAQINQFLSEQEAIKKYFEQCVERGFETKEESLVIVPYRPKSLRVHECSVARISKA